MADSPSKQLVLTWDGGADFLECFEEGEPRRIRTALSEGQDWPETGSLCALVLRLNDREAEFQMHGLLAARQGQVAVFELLSEERMRHELVLVGARGESLPYRRRRHTRIPCHLRADVHGENGSSITTHTTTLGAGGVHLILAQPMDPDQVIRITLSLADGRQISLAGRVTSRIDEGPEKGNSIEFLFESAAQRNELATIAAELETTSSRTGR